MTALGIWLPASGGGEDHQAYGASIGHSSDSASSNTKQAGVGGVLPLHLLSAGLSGKYKRGAFEIKHAAPPSGYADNIHPHSTKKH